MFSLKSLLYFVTAADKGSITAAANALNISQPSITAAVAQLENTFGVQLLVRRHAQGVSLTPAGRRFVAEARSLLAHADELKQSARQLGGGLSGELDVGCFITFAPLLMPALLHSFNMHFPHTRIRLHETHIKNLLERLSDGRIELALTFDLSLEPYLEFEPLAEIPLYALLPSGHRLAASPTVALRDLVAEPLILLGLPESREYFLSIFQRLNLEPRIFFETVSYDMVNAMVAHGHGYSIRHSRSPSATATIGGAGLVYREIEESIKPAWLGIARMKQIRPTRMSIAFAEFCATYIATPPIRPEEGSFGTRILQMTGIETNGVAKDRTSLTRKI
jgi:DNA-binding transcriptional LysR family regulator